MKSVLVIGYGNTLRGDDAAGVRAAELIAERHPEISCITTHQLTPELAEHISEFETVIFLDAQVEIEKPHIRSLHAHDGQSQPRTHFASPESLLALCKQLYARVPEKIFQVGIPATKLDFSEELSLSTMAAVNEAAALVEQQLGKS